MKIAQVIPILLSMLMPGVGHIAAGRALRGILLFFLFGFAIDGWLYSQAASVLPPERSALDIPTIRNLSLGLGALLWAFAVLDTVAIALRRRRILAKADVADAHIRGALVAHLRNEPEAAIKELRAARRINDQDPDALFHLGVIYAGLGQRAKARKAFHQCISYDSEGKWDAHAQEQLRALEAVSSSKSRGSRSDKEPPPPQRETRNAKRETPDAKRETPPSEEGVP